MSITPQFPRPNITSKPFKAVAAAVHAACDSTPPSSDARQRALANVRWVLRRGETRKWGNYIALDDALNPCLVDDIAYAAVFDGRDNEAAKALFFSALKSGPFVPQLLPAA